MQTDNFLDEIKQQFNLGEQDVNAYSPLVLAYIGDVVYELIIRTILVERRGGTVQKLHREATWFVKAATQAKMAVFLQPYLTAEEEAVYRRGRNAKPHTVPKNADMSDYHKATGLEALMGYWYFTKQNEHMLDMISKAIEAVDKKSNADNG